MAITDNIYLVVMRALISRLREQLTDPLSGRIEWITGAFPPLQYSKPHICIQKLGKPFRKEISHGNVGEIASYRYNISVFVSGTITFDIDSTKYSGPFLLEYLASKVDRALKTSRVWFETNYDEWFEDIEVSTGQNVPYKESLDEYRYDTNVIIQLCEFY